MHQMDCQCSPPRCRRMPGFYLPMRRVAHGGSPYPQAGRMINVAVATSVMLTFGLVLVGDSYCPE